MVTRKYYNTFCEICGTMGNFFNDDGWTTCEPHRTQERPEKPIFMWNTGEAWGDREITRPWTTPPEV